MKMGRSGYGATLRRGCPERCVEEPDGAPAFAVSGLQRVAVADACDGVALNNISSDCLTDDNSYIDTVYLSDIILHHHPHEAFPSRSA